MNSLLGTGNYSTGRRRRGSGHSTAGGVGAGGSGVVLKDSAMNYPFPDQPCIVTSDSRQIVADGASARVGGGDGCYGAVSTLTSTAKAANSSSSSSSHSTRLYRRFNKAIIILSVFVLVHVNYCHGLSSSAAATEVTSTPAAAETVIDTNASDELDSYFQEWRSLESAETEDVLPNSQEQRTNAAEEIRPGVDYADCDREESQKLVATTEIGETSSLKPNLDMEFETDYDNRNYDSISGRTSNRSNEDEEDDENHERLHDNQSANLTTTTDAQLNKDFAVKTKQNKNELVASSSLEVGAEDSRGSSLSYTISAEETTKTVKSRRRRNNHSNHAPATTAQQASRASRLMGREKDSAASSALDYWSNDNDEDDVDGRQEEVIKEVEQQQQQRQLGSLGSSNRNGSPQKNKKFISGVQRDVANLEDIMRMLKPPFPFEKHRENRHKHQRPRHNKNKTPKEPNDDELEKRHRKFAKEKYQRKLEKARKMQLRRDMKLKNQSRQLAQLERQQQARQKVYFGNFADENKQFDTVDDIDQHIDGVEGKERYPNLARLQSQLKEDRDKELPPYIRKYNRRNKQLFDIIEGTNSPDASGHSKHHHHGHHHHNHRSHKTNPNRHIQDYSSVPDHYHNQHQPHHHHQHHYQQHSHRGGDHLTHKEKTERWIEENLFEEQRRNPNQIVRPPEEDPEQLGLNKINEIPMGVAAPVAADEVDSTSAPASSGSAGKNVVTSRLSQTRAGNFVYHRIAQSQPSNTIGQAYGVIVRKPGLPFVAITDRRQEHGKSKHV